jgi:(p)ppGpp synthase/HD superfamily hydrolase
MAIPDQPEYVAGSEFFLIKLPDRLHNLVTLWDCAESKRERKITETELFYLPFAEQHGILIHELEESIRELREASAVLA